MAEYPSLLGDPLGRAVLLMSAAAVIEAQAAALRAAGYENHVEALDSYVEVLRGDAAYEEDVAREDNDLVREALWHVVQRGDISDQTRGNAHNLRERLASALSPQERT